MIYQVEILLADSTVSTEQIDAPWIHAALRLALELNPGARSASCLGGYFQYAS